MLAGAHAVVTLLVGCAVVDLLQNSYLEECCQKSVLPYYKSHDRQSGETNLTSRKSVVSYSMSSTSTNLESL